MADEKRTGFFTVGEMFGDYTVEKLLGEGGMGAVYLVRAPGGERYAVKLMFPEIVKKGSDYRKRFAREAEFSMQIRHKNLISVYDVGEDPETGYCYIIMDYVPGGSVADRLEKNGPLPMAEAVSIAAQVALALEVAHRRGVVHRDIKPDNIMFDVDGTPKLADLGVAKFTDEAHKTTVTTTGMIIGTPAYMAPEQMMDSHHIDARADIYALGVVLYEMLTGKRPNEGSTAVELLAKAIKGEPLPDVRTMRPEVSAAIAHVLSLMCAPKPENRPATALAAAQLLQKAATGWLALPKKPPRAADAAARKKKRGIPLMGIAAAVAVLCSVVGIANLLSKSPLPVSSAGVPVLTTTNVIERTVVVTNLVEREMVVTNFGMTSVRAASNGISHGIADAPVVPYEPKTELHARSAALKEADGPAEEKRPPGICTARANGYSWSYKLDDNGNAVLTSGGEDICLSPRPVGKVVVPAVLDGHRVVAIDHVAFRDCPKMTAIEFPEGLEEIRGWYIFSRCHGLTEVTIPKSLCRIGTWAFESCTNLRRVNLMNCERADNGFGCIFIGCYALEEMLCSKNNRAIASVDGVLYSKDKKTLLAYPKTRKEIKLLPGVTSIANSALVSLPMRHVRIPDGIVFVDGHNFEYDWKGTIETVEFPKSLKAIGDALFKETKSVKRVVFRGSAPDIPKNGPFLETDADFIVEVPRRSKGWNGPSSVDLPERWPVGAGGDSRRIRYSGEMDEQVVAPDQNPAKLASLKVTYEKDSTRAVQKALNALFPGWKTNVNRARSKCKYFDDVGFVPEKCGRRNLVATIPESEGSPVVLLRTVTLTAERHTFTYAVRKYPSAGGGMRIRVLVNGKTVSDESISDGEWHEPEIDLSNWVGRTVKLKVEHYPLKNNAHVANAFWSRLEVR